MNPGPSGPTTKLPWETSQGSVVILESKLREREKVRARLQAERAGFGSDFHRTASRTICQRIERILDREKSETVALYRPIQREPDIRPLAEVLAPAVTLALPVVVEKAAPLAFCVWAPGEPLTRGNFGIEVPEEQRPIDPEVLVIPMLGFDYELYRLGHGGGYYDRTLAAVEPRPLTIGVAFACGRIESIDPEPHDQKMDFVVTEEKTWHGRTDRASRDGSPPSPGSTPRTP